MSFGGKLKNYWTFGEKYKDLKLKEIISQNTNEFCHQTTLHGMKYVADNTLRPVERCFFGISIITVVGVAIYLTARIYDKWSTTPIIVGINPVPTFIASEPFPAVTICNLNKALDSVATTFSKNSSEYALLKLVCRRDSSTFPDKSVMNWMNVENFIVNVSQPCENMFISCRFGGIFYNCSRLFYPLVTDEGFCCIFNMLNAKFMYVSHSTFTMANGYNLEIEKTEIPRESANQMKVNQRLKSIKLSLKQNVKEFCKNTTLHGLSYLANKDLYPMERAFFALSFVSVVGIAGFFISNVYTKWSTTPVIFSINPKPTFITNEPFTALTICNMNQAYKDKALQYDKNSEEYAIIQMLCAREINVSVPNTINKWSTLNKFLTDISQPCEKMLVSCRFGGIDYDCSRIFHPIITDEGLCCAFNMVHPKFMYTEGTKSLINETSTNHRKVGTAVPWTAETGYPSKLPNNFYPRTAAGTGESLGLTVILDVEADQYYCSSANGFGFKMAMHSPTETPNVREVGLLVAAGYETKARVRIEKLEADQKLHYVDLKHRQCQFEDEHDLTYFATYTQSNCEAECVAESLMRHCGCHSHYLPKRFGNETVCSIHNIKCVERIRLHSMINDDNDNESECDEVCMPSCYDLRFYAEFFTTPLEHVGFKMGGNRKIQALNESYVEKNIAIFTMYYKDNSFRSNKQTEYIGMTDVLSSVGGLISLFFGFSFISLAEMIFYTLIRPWRKVRKSTAKPKSTKKQRRNQRNWPIALMKLRRPSNASLFRVTPNIMNISSSISGDNYLLDSKIRKNSHCEKDYYLQRDWRLDFME